MIHTHVHTMYSLLDGESSPARLAKRAKELNMSALCLTDHNHLLGVIDFKESCEQEGIQPILGIELYYTNDTYILSMSAEERHKIALEKAIANGVEIPVKPKPTKKFVNELIKDYAYPTKQFHILFLAKNEIGYKNLVKLQSEASRLCTYNGRYICDNHLIERYKEGLIMTTACLGSRTAQLILDNKEDMALELILKWHAMFGDDFYLEIQPLLDNEQYLVNQFYIQVAQEHNINIIASNDVHYATQEDIDDHDSLLCIGTGKLKSDAERMRYQPEFWLRSESEMIEAFSNQFQIYGDESDTDYLENCLVALNNTDLIADKCVNDYNIGASFSLFPQVKTTGSYTPERFLEKLCWERLYHYLNKYPNLDRRKYEARLKEELDVINPKGFAPYMLVNQEVVDWCKANKIPTGPGRGSAAGSLILLLLGITKVIDPVEHQLLFSRFLTKDRASLPDVDIDYSYKRRQEVIAHLEDTYGAANVAHIGTISALGVKSGLKDFGRVLDINYDLVNDLTSKIDEIMDYIPSYKFKHIDKLQEGSERDKDKYREFQQLEKDNSEIFRLARKYEGTPRSCGTHASGILVMPVPVSDVFPTKTDKDGIQTCLFDGVQLDRFESLKLDCLGLKTLDTINDTIMSVDPNKNIYNLYDENIIPLKNANYFKDICLGKTDAIFQIESGLFKGIIKDMQPHDISDITALSALGRPGPLSSGMHTMYNNRKNGLESWGEPLPNTLDLVEATYGAIVYQEQPMIIAQRVAGFDGNQADSYLRKSMAKKKADLLKLCKIWFVWGKRNEEAPADYDASNENQVMYDPTGKYGAPIKGGVNNGYNEQDLITFFDSLEGFASYLFNKSHSATYGWITCATAYLAHYYRPQFMAQVLSIEEKKEKIDYYIDVCKQNKIQVLPPNINESDEDFKAINNSILYGLKKIAKVGKTCGEIIANRPYLSLEDLQTKVKPNKSVFENLIKAGCFDFIDSNRNVLLNQVYAMRGDKDKETKQLLRVDESSYDKETCRLYEQDTIKTLLTYPCLYKEVPLNKTIVLACILEEFKERRDKNGNMMGFYKLNIDGETVDALCFARTHTGIRLELEHAYKNNKTLYLAGKKDDKNKFLVSSLTKDASKVFGADLLAELPKPNLSA